MFYFKQRSILDFDEPNLSDQYSIDPAGVDESFQSFFSSLDLGNSPEGSGSDEPANTEDPGGVGAQPDGNAPPAGTDPNNPSSPQDGQINPNQPAPSGDPQPTPEQVKITALENQIQMLTQAIQNNSQQQIDSPPPAAPVDPFESESFQNLSTVMQWDAEEQSAMKNWLKSAFDFNSQAIMDQATGTINEVVNSSLSVAQKRDAIKAKFYEDHPMLSNTKPFVSEVAKSITKEFQALGKPMDPMSILTETARRSYQALGINPGQQPNNQTPVQPNNGQPGSGTPAFASGTGGGGRKPPVQKSEDQQMIDAIIDLDI